MPASACACCCWRWKYHACFRPPFEAPHVAATGSHRTCHNLTPIHAHAFSRFQPGWTLRRKMRSMMRSHTTLRQASRTSVLFVLVATHRSWALPPNRRKAASKNGLNLCQPTQYRCLWPKNQTAHRPHCAHDRAPLRTTLQKAGHPGRNSTPPQLSTVALSAYSTCSASSGETSATKFAEAETAVRTATHTMSLFDLKTKADDKLEHYQSRTALEYNRRILHHHDVSHGFFVRTHHSHTDIHFFHEEIEQNNLMSVRAPCTQVSSDTKKC